MTWIGAELLAGVMAHLAMASVHDTPSLPARLPHAADSFVVVAPGPNYRQGRLIRSLLGSHYRDLWVTPMRVPILSLQTYAGGLTPLEQHVGSQTHSLRFQGADHREYQFRALYKHPASILPPGLEHSVVAKLLQDGSSATHPVGSLVASPLLQAAGVLHPEQTLAVLPDDPALAQFRADWTGVLGMIEQRPVEGTDGGEAFGGARKVASSTALFKRIDRSPDDRVDPDGFLAARLTDILMGDRDRHRDNFRWATYSQDAPRLWQPISRDHDEAFVRLDGPVLDLSAWYFPQLVRFGERYPAYDHLNWHAREIDRRFLVGLDRQDWDSVATALQTRLSNDVIDDAVHHLPKEMYKVGGPELARLLKVRRDGLAREALGYYDFLAKQVEIHATNAPEVATITRVDDRHVDVTIRSQGAGLQPYFQRQFTAGETAEIRLNMWGGDDSVIVRGAGHAPIRLRVVGGEGDDVFVDSSRVGGVSWYDDTGVHASSFGREMAVNRKPFPEWVGSDDQRYPPRDWGVWLRPVVWGIANGDVGVVAGAGLWRTAYGFRRSPYASDLRWHVAYAPSASTFHSELLGDFRRENSSIHWKTHLLASGIEAVRYFGQGNSTASARGGNYYKVNQQLYAFQASLVLPLRRTVELSFGPEASWSHTGDNAGRFFATIEDTTYGGRHFGQVGGRLALDVETRDRPSNARSGMHLHAAGRVFPAVGEVKRAFGSGEGEAGTELSVRRWPAPTLAIRAGGKKVWGAFPFHESAFLGGRSSLRGYYQQRFAGDASLYGSAELRLALARSSGWLPAQWGIFGGADGGRVYVDGASPGGWHTSLGGGISMAVLDRAATVTLGLTVNRERNAVYAAAGFPF